MAEDVAGEEDAGPPPQIPPPPRESTPGKYFAVANKDIISLLATWSAKKLDESNPRVAQKKQEFAEYLDYVEIAQDAYPHKLPRDFVSVDSANTRLLGGLKMIFDPKHSSRQLYFTDQDKIRAKELYDWAEQVDTIPEVPVATSDNEAAPDRSAERPATAKNSQYPIRKPPQGHPVWGKNGIMHGIALTGKHGKKPCLNPDYENEKRNAAVPGHNGLEVGAWFPSQLRALFVGAHGSSEAGIHGRKDEGAYSVIVSGAYDDLDVDKGDVLYYSGSRSLESKDPTRAPPRSHGTSSLHVSFENGRLVRVIRKAVDKNKHSTWAPHCGLRYDGLYRVTWCGTKKNKNNGLFEQFKLVREPGQPPLSDLANIPTLAQRNDYAKVARHF